ncbi:hypothetical protein [Eisenibacter elegans]|jgi:uncharacterized protein YxjI|uniref:hypothetical protein n=1 Tax=Eisenibacter elegans TaxID=997 RepID=UPI00040C4FCB|nr:hypothetical protein [Eisenibacter elegans]
MSTFAFPLELRFKIATIANDFVAKDASGKTLAYIRQKIFKLKSEVEVFSDESKRQKMYTIKANQWIDFSASYNFLDYEGKSIGRIGRKGWRSLWKAHYDLYDSQDQHEFVVNEENAWIKVIDSAVGELPLIGAFTGYVFNPAYLVKRVDNGQIVAKLRKEPSFWGRKFTIHKLEEMPPHDEERILLGLMMMILLERRRG